MTTTVEQLQAALLPCASGGAYQDIAIQGAVAPYIVWTQIVSTTNNTLAGATNMQNMRIQIDVWAKTPAIRQTVVAAVVAAMAAAPFANLQISTQNLYESETKLFRTILDFSVWSAN